MRRLLSVPRVHSLPCRVPHVPAQGTHVVLVNQGVPQGYEVTCSQGSVHVLRSAVLLPEARNLCKRQAGGWLLPQPRPCMQRPLLPLASLPSAMDGPQGQGPRGGSSPAPRGLARAPCCPGNRGGQHLGLPPGQPSQPCWSESPESQWGNTSAQILPLLPTSTQTRASRGSGKGLAPLVSTDCGAGGTVSRAA